MKTLLLALGNPILSDDGVGWLVADRLAERLGNIDVIKSSAATMDLVPKLAGYDRLVVVDAIASGSSPPGAVRRLSLDDLAETVRHSSPHDINFATAFQIAKQWGYHVPEDIRIYAIEVKELTRFAESCTPQVAEKLDDITSQILLDLAD
jgi:hydrogenase maturation protease